MTEDIEDDNNNIINTIDNIDGNEHQNSDIHTVNVLSNNTLICKCAIALRILFTKLFDPCCKGSQPTTDTI